MEQCDLFVHGWRCVLGTGHEGDCNPGVICELKLEIARLRAEVARLEAVLRETHTNYCCEAYTDRDLHAPECLLYEIEERAALDAAKERIMEKTTWKFYRKSALQEMRPYIPGESLDGISVSSEDTPEPGGMIARNVKNPNDQWYVAKQFFADNYEALDAAKEAT